MEAVEDSVVTVEAVVEDLEVETVVDVVDSVVDAAVTEVRTFPNFSPQFWLIFLPSHRWCPWTRTWWRRPWWPWTW